MCSALFVFTLFVMISQAHASVDFIKSNESSHFTLINLTRSANSKFLIFKCDHVEKPIIVIAHKGMWKWYNRYRVIDLFQAKHDTLL